jgi:hypothetical protein
MPFPVHLDPERFFALDPTSGALDAKSNLRPLARRGQTLDHAVLALIDNGFNPRFAQAVIDQLCARFNLADVIWVKKRSVSVPPDKGDWERVTARATAGIALYGG